MTTRRPVVVIDPGHGGSEDAGGSSHNNTSGGGLFEKDLTLDIARRVREQLAGRAQVLLTRDSDTNLSLTQRAGFARSMGAEVFVSLHCNGHADPTVDSTEVYVSRRVSPEGRRFATELRGAVAAVTGASRGGVVEADLGVLLPDRHDPSTLAALVEMFDLTNADRATRAANVAFLDEVASAVADTLDAHLPAVPPDAAAARAQAMGAAPVSVRTPEVERAVASLRERGIADDDIQRFLAELEGGTTQLGGLSARVLDDGRVGLEVPPAHLYEEWQAELVLAALAGAGIFPLLAPLQALATAHNVTIGIGPAVTGGLVAGGGLSAGLLVAPGNRLGFYGTASGVLGAIVSISGSLQVTVVFGGPDLFGGSSVAAGVTIDPGVGPTIGAHMLMSTNGGGVIGVTGEIGLSAGLSPFEAFVQYQHTATTLGVPVVRAQGIGDKVDEVLEHIRDEARRRALPPSMPAGSNFMSVLQSRYLSGYLSSPSPVEGRAAVEAIGAQNTSGVVTEVCGAPDQWEEGTPHWNQSPVPSAIRLIPGMGDLPDNFGAATEILTVANRRSLGYIDLPFLVGRHTVDELDCANARAAVGDADWMANNGINTSQLMHWATGVRFGSVSHELMRDLFLAYELWHLEMWDVFGHDPINDLIAEDAGRHMAERLLNGSITRSNLNAVIEEGFRQARAWVGGLLDIRRSQLDAQITAMEPPPAEFWTGRRYEHDDPNHPYRSPSIRRMLTDGQTVSQVKSSRLVEDYIQVYTLIFEARANPPDISMIQRLEASGSLDGTVRAPAPDDGESPTSPTAPTMGSSAVPASSSIGLGSSVATTHPRGYAAPLGNPLRDPLTAAEWDLITRWLAAGSVEGMDLTGDSVSDAEIAAAGVYCSRTADPAVCSGGQPVATDPDVVQNLVPLVTARGSIVHWPAVGHDDRRRYVMERLVTHYGYPVNGAAGLVGNLDAESAVIPSRIEGSRPGTPMRAPDLAGGTRDFTADEVMNRNHSAGQGPRRPGIGLAQWTSSGRRSGLFTHSYNGLVKGAAVLFDMDAQIDYLVDELRTSYSGVEAVLTDPAVTVADAADEVVYNFEIPGSVLTPRDASGQRHKLPRTDAAVQVVFTARRGLAQQALNTYP